MVVTFSAIPGAPANSDGIRVYNAVFVGIGLFLVSVGAGGIKPCVSTFGAEQISSKDPRVMAKYFSLFYLMINLGSMLSMLVSPMMRKMKCGALGAATSCFFGAFLVPAILL